MTNLFFLFIFVPILSLILLALNIILAPHKPDESKVSVYECGFEAIRGQTRSTFQIQFMVVALLFLIFDLELILLFPIAVTLYKVSIFGFSIAILFFIILTIGFILEIGSGAIHLSNLDLSIKNLDQTKKNNFNKNLKKKFFTFNNSSTSYPIPVKSIKMESEASNPIINFNSMLKIQVTNIKKILAAAQLRSSTKAWAVNKIENFFLAFRVSSLKNLLYKFIRPSPQPKVVAKPLKTFSFNQLHPLIRILIISWIIFLIFIILYLFYNYNLIFNSQFYSLYLSKINNAILHSYPVSESITVFRIKIFFIVILIGINFFFFFIDAKQKIEIKKYADPKSPVLESNITLDKTIKESWKFLLGAAAIYNVALAKKNDNRAEIIFNKALKKEANEKNFSDLVDEISNLKEENRKLLIKNIQSADHIDKIDQSIEILKKKLTKFREGRLNNNSDFNTSDIEIAKVFCDVETLAIIHKRFMDENPDIKAKFENSNILSQIDIKSAFPRLDTDKDLLKTTEELEIKKSFMLFGIWDFFFEKYETLDIVGKLAIGILILKSTLVSAFMSIIFIFYGDFLIKKYNIENRFPKLAEIIKLRRKFSTYYLIWNASLIIAVISVESLFCIAVIFDL